MPRIRTAPGEFLVEPAGYQVFEKVREQGQPVRVAKRKIEMVVDDPAVAIDSCRRTIDIPDSFQYERDGTRSHDYIEQVLLRQANTVDRKSSRIVKRRQVARIVEQAAAKKDAK